MALTDIRTSHEFMAAYPEIFESMFGRLRVVAHVMHGFAGWVLFAHPAGHFVTACLEDSLVDSLGRADEHNREHIWDIAMWLYNDCPSAAWRKERMTAWAEQGGLMGIWKKDGRTTPNW
jgi:hypothetical protein